MNWKNVYRLPIASNVCNQVLREVDRETGWSMAHVVMARGARSLLHLHQTMTEIYAITGGTGELLVGDQAYKVERGNVVVIPPGTPHMLINEPSQRLEHLVFAFPPFDRNDVILLEQKPHENQAVALPLPIIQEAGDGGKIRAYAFPELDMSIAVGEVLSHRPSRDHRHTTFSEWVYVIRESGQASIEIEGRRLVLKTGDWFKISLDEDHAFRNDSNGDLLLMCICSPAINPKDVHFA
jgi:mannose-6-phosphate isomerase-like protein (cupin superfamily)